MKICFPCSETIIYTITYTDSIQPVASALAPTQSSPAVVAEIKVKVRVLALSMLNYANVKQYTLGGLYTTFLLLSY